MGANTDITSTDVRAGSSAQRVPLLVFIGPPGVGKSSAARELSHLLEEARIAFAYVDRDDFGVDGLLHEDPLLGLNELLHARVATGAQRLVVAWRVESGLQLARFRTPRLGRHHGLSPARRAGHAHGADRRLVRESVLP